ncbi:hypothetical protein BYT27DRAFT_7063348, partial [Phlegmacium glaucopus]
MPSRYDPSAPKFDGKPSSLIRFLDEIAQLGTQHGLSQRELIIWTIRYAPDEEYELWSMQTSANMSNWANFKAELINLYPGAIDSWKYSISDLEKLVENQVLASIRNQDEFGQYYRSFLRIAMYLQSKSRLSNREVSNYFLRGLQANLRAQVRLQLRMKSPFHHPDDPWPLEDIYLASIFIL